MKCARSTVGTLMAICSRFTFNAVVSFTKEFEMSGFNSIRFYLCSMPHSMAFNEIQEIQTNFCLDSVHTAHTAHKHIYTHISMGCGI